MIYKTVRINVWHMKARHNEIIFIVWRSGWLHLAIDCQTCVQLSAQTFFQTIKLREVGRWGGQGVKISNLLPPFISKLLGRTELLH